MVDEEIKVPKGGDIPLLSYATQPSFPWIGFRSFANLDASIAIAGK
jgi:hypothetical protein